MKVGIFNMTRKKSRERTVFALYNALINMSINAEVEPKVLLCDSFNQSYEDIDADFKAIFVKALLNKEEIEERIDEFLIDWSFSRLSYVVQAILLTSYSESVLVKSAPKQVSINEAVDITKKYDTEEDSKFVNAVLERTISKALNIPSDYKNPIKYEEDNNEELAELLKDKDNEIKKDE